MQDLSVKRGNFELSSGLAHKKKSYSHIRNSSKSIEWYMEFLGSPIKLAKLKKPKRIIRDCLTEKEIQEIISSCKDIREKVLILILAYSGLRAREVCALRGSDINLAERSILVRDGKGAQDRIVYVPEGCIKVLQEYISNNHKKGSSLFINKTNNQQLSPYMLRETIKKITKLTTLEKRIYPHLFRHSLATNLLINGCNLLTIQEQLGHRDIQTTLIYLHSTPTIRRTMYDKFCPRYLE